MGVMWGALRLILWFKMRSHSCSLARKMLPLGLLSAYVTTSEWRQVHSRQSRGVQLPTIRAQSDCCNAGHVGMVCMAWQHMRCCDWRRCSRILKKLGAACALPKAAAL